jgi:hypothetical protein
MARKLDFETLHNSTVRIEAASESGTGFFIAPKRILTCAHVVSSVAIGADVTVIWRGSRFKGTLAKKLPNTNEKAGTYPDLAELEVPISEHPIVRIVADHEAQDPVYVYGFSDKNPEGVSVTAGVDGPVHFGTSGDQELFAFKNGQFRPGMSATSPHHQ